MANLLICYIKSYSIIKYPNLLKKPNLTLDHLIAFILESKLDISYLISLDHFLTSIFNHSF